VAGNPIASQKLRHDDNAPSVANRFYDEDDPRGNPADRDLAVREAYKPSP
jgi:hypothetical protein